MSTHLFSLHNGGLGSSNRPLSYVNDKENNTFPIILPKLLPMQAKPYPISAVSQSVMVYLMGEGFDCNYFMQCP